MPLTQTEFNDAVTDWFDNSRSGTACPHQSKWSQARHASDCKPFSLVFTSVA